MQSQAEPLGYLGIIRRLKGGAWRFKVYEVLDKEQVETLPGFKKKVNPPIRFFGAGAHLEFTTRGCTHIIGHMQEFRLGKSLKFIYYCAALHDKDVDLEWYARQMCSNLIMNGFELTPEST